MSKEFFQRGTSDYYPTLTKLLTKNPDAIDVGVAAPAGTPAKQARELGFKGKIWGSGTDASTLITTGGPGAEGFVAYFMAFDYYSQDAKPLQRDLAERYKVKYNEPMTSLYAEMTYVATKALVKAIETSGSVDTTKIAETFRKDGFEWDTLVPNVKSRMTGEKTYGIRSIVSAPFYITEVKDGKVILLSTAIANVP